MSDETPATGTKLRNAVEQGAGRLIVTHLTKIVSVLAALLVLVWNLRGGVEQREHRLGRVEAEATEALKRCKRVERQLWRLGITVPPTQAAPRGRKDHTL